LVRSYKGTLTNESNYWGYYSFGEGNITISVSRYLASSLLIMKNERWPNGNVYTTLRSVSALVYGF